jgi:hypothetical protein
MYEEFVPLTPEKEKRVQARVGELARNIQLRGAKVKELKSRPLAKFRPGIKKDIVSNVTSAKKEAGLVGKASDALIRSSIDREASTRSKINKLKNQLGDSEGRNNIRRFNREELEYILDVLISEGYVDTYNSGILVLESLSYEMKLTLLNC